MKTPTEWFNNLKRGIVTKEMLEAALYSVNKRAKNCRDQKRYYKHNFDYYHNEEKYERQEKEYYRKKETMLKYVAPSAIHIEHMGFQRGEIVWYEHLHINTLISDFFNGRIENIKEDYYGFAPFYTYSLANLNEEFCQYYLFYDLGDHTFHSPIQKKDLDKYSDIPIIHISRLDTTGKDIADICSVQFVDKVIETLKNNPTYFDAKECKEISDFDVEAYKTHHIEENRYNACLDLGWFIFKELLNYIKRTPKYFNYMVLSNEYTEYIKERCISIADKKLENFQQDALLRLENAERYYQKVVDNNYLTHRERKHAKGVLKKLGKLPKCNVEQIFKNDNRTVVANYAFYKKAFEYHDNIRVINTLDDLAEWFVEYVNSSGSFPPIVSNNFAEKYIRKYIEKQVEIKYKEDMVKMQTVYTKLRNILIERNYLGK